MENTNYLSLQQLFNDQATFYAGMVIYGDVEVEKAIDQLVDTKENWEFENPVLKLGYVGIESDTNRFKFGDGETPWNDLPYAVAASTQGSAGSNGSQGVQGIQGITGAGTQGAPQRDRDGAHRRAAGGRWAGRL